ncbi:uncharacterized protein LTR77_000295 [Saxophila tyrrhenica]|uniref:PARP catalytic domain-containing protein n=1 Tax=Saxophila tyrrhenica TaxID=1690608 RepID=A0AAV9PPE4_9PEZI|nr:hypothetical protein LTR77_000295 [Saxophila tyrrhenica]
MDDDLHNTDTREEFHPPWLSRPRDFVDRRAEEAEAFNELLTQHLNTSAQTWDCDETGWTFELRHVILHIRHQEAGHLVAKAESEVMPRKYLDGLRCELRNMPWEADENSCTTLDLACALLRMTEEAVAWEELWNQKLAAYDGRRAAATKNAREFEQKLHRDGSDRRGFDARSIRGYDSVLANPYGVNFSSLDDTAAFLLGKPIERICNMISTDFRIIHVEPVFRDNLVSSFLKRKEQIYDQLSRMSRGSLRQSVPTTVIRPNSVEDTREGLARQLSMPKVTFHGAPRAVIESIVRYGFIVPGSQVGNSGMTISVRCGATYGTGIYSSPDAAFASHYLDYQTGNVRLSKPSEIPGMRLVVCATLMGRAMTVDSAEARRVKGVLSPHAHSHVSGDGLQYIVFESSQIIPCYVLHLDYGAEHAKAEFEKLASDPTVYFQKRSKKKKVDSTEDAWDEWYRSEPGAIQDKKVALKAAARKWFPYGYGPAQGNSFVIEDMAEHSDDEEVYGDFQHQRIEQDDEIREARPAKGGSWLDQYQTVRKTQKELDFGVDGGM